MSKTIKDFIGDRPAPVYTASPGDSLKEVVMKMIDSHVGCLVVKDGDSYTGIVTERDVMHAVSDFDDVCAISVSKVMTKKIRFIAPDDTLEYAAKVMRKKGIRHLPVFDGDNILYVLSIRDIAFAELDELQDEVNILTDYIS
ncbi:MAG TPA: CBS domain-containing protein [Nitrospirae bacterium]|nr:CBS domain-containing protein [Nitrospirota bacterium]